VDIRSPPFDSVEQTYVPMETEDQVLPLDGMCIHAVAPASVPPAFDDDPAAQMRKKTLVPGRNAIGLPITGSTPAYGALFSVKDRPELSGWLRRRNTEKRG